MTEALKFDILAADRASQVFDKVADSVGDVTDEMRKLDRQKAEPKIDVDTKRAEEKIQRFAKNLRRRVEAAVKALPDVEITADSSDADREIAQVRRELAELGNKEIGVDIDAAAAEAKLRELTARLRRMNAESVDVKLKADTLAAVQALSKVKLDAIKLDVDTDAAGRQVGSFVTDMRRRIDAAVKTLPELEIDADSSDVDRELARIRDELRALGDAEIGVDIDAAEADARLRELKLQLEELGASSADVRVHADTAAAIAALKVVDEEVDGLDGRTARIKIDVDRSLSETLIQVAALGRALGALALPAGIVAAVPHVAALGAAAVSAAGAVGLIPGVAAAAAGGIGTLALGFRNFGDAVTEEDPAKAAEAIGKLAPQAQEAARAIRGLGESWGDLQLATQNTMFTGLGKVITDLGQLYIPILGDATERMAEHFNRGAHELSAFLQQARTVETVKSLFSDVENTVEQLADTFAPLTSAVLDLAAGGTEVLHELSRGAGEAAIGFAGMVREARESGRLQDWIRGGVTALGQLVSITKNVGSSLLSVFDAGERAFGGTFLSNLDRGAQAMATWLGSAEGMATVTATFRGINDVVAALWPGIRDLGGALLTVVGMLGQAGVFTGFATALSAIMTAAAPLVQILGALATAVLPPLLAIVSALAPVLVPLAAGLLAIRAAAAGAGKLREFTGSLTGARAATVAALSPAAQMSAQLRGQTTAARQAGTAQAGLTGVVGRLATAQSAMAATGRSMADSYRSTAGAVQGFADRAGAAAQQAGDALGARLAASASRGVEGVLRVPRAVADAARSAASSARDLGRSISTGLQTGVIYARETLRDLPKIADQAMERLRTSLYAGAVNAADGFRTAVYDMRRSVAIAADAATDLGRQVRTGVSNAAAALRELPARAADAGRALGTGLRTGVSNAVGALRELPAAAATAGQALHTGLQRGVIYAQESLRQLPAQAANAGRALADGLRTGAATAADAVRTMGSNIATGARTAATSVADGMRAIPGHIQGAFSTAGQHVSNFVSTLGRISGAVAGAGSAIGSGLSRGLLGAKVEIDGIQTRMGGLVGFLGGPWGVALTVAGAALSILGQKQAEAAQKAAEHQAALQAVTATLDQQTGAATQATSAEVAKQLAADGSLDKLDALGVSTADYTKAMTGNSQAIDTVTGKLHSATVASIGQSNAYKDLAPILDRAGISLDTVALAAEGNVDAQKQVTDAVRAAGAATPETASKFGMLADQLLKSGGASAELQGRLNETAGAIESQRNALQRAAVAAGDFSAELQSVTPGFQALAQGASITPVLQGHFDSLADAARKNAQSVAENALAFGNVETAGAAAAQAMQKSRDDFIAAATGAGMTQDAAAKLADQLGLIPSKAKVDFETNATTTAQQLVTLNDQIRAVPPGKSVTVDALTAPAEQSLSALGVTVERMPDGKVKITAPTEAAKANLDAFVRGANERRAQIPIDGQPQPAQNALASVLAQIAAGKATVNIDGNDVPARTALSYLIGSVGGMKGDIQIGANKVPADQVLSAYLAAVESGSGTVDINGNRIPADAVLQALVGGILGTRADMQLGADASIANGIVQQTVALANGSTGTITIDGNQTPANGKITGSIQLANGSTGVITVDANQTPANGKIQATVRYADGSTGTVTVNARDLASPVINRLKQPTSSTHTVNVRYNDRPFRPGAGLTTRAAGAYAVPRAKGAYAEPALYAKGGFRNLRPMSAARAEIVPARQPRVIGDRMQGDEAFIPVNRSPRSRSILAQTANGMGYDLVPHAGTKAMADGGMLTAARQILARMKSGQQLYEDWSWRGAPAEVGRYNDALHNARERAGYSYARGRAFLEDYIRRAALTSTPKAAAGAAATQIQQQARAASTSVQAANAAAQSAATAGIAELRALIGRADAQIGLLRGMRGDLGRGQGWPEVVGQLERLGRVLAQAGSTPATQRSAAARDTAAVGDWL